jgi:hypothetical protein
MGVTCENMSGKGSKKVLTALAAPGLLVVLLGGVSFLPPAQACPAIGPPVEGGAPGWSWEQDVYNGCAYTLFNEQGERAPGEVYDDLQLEPPSPAFLYPPRLLGIVAMAVAIAGLVALIPRIRRPRQSSNHPGLPTSATSTWEP